MREQEGPDRRAVPRLKREVLVQYRIKQLPQAAGIQVFQMPQKDLSRTKDLSERGILFTVSQALPLQTVLELKLQLPLQKETIDLEGRVVGCTEIKKDLIYGIRVEFTKLVEEKSKLLKRFVQIFKNKGK